jgi:hypothetical protein
MLATYVQRPETLDGLDKHMHRGESHRDVAHHSNQGGTHINMAHVYQGGFHMIVADMI